jgi:nitronate monooxygenase
LRRVYEAGALILGCATSPAEARWLAERQVDAIIAQGWEAGGHAGRFLPADPSSHIGTFALVPQVVAAVRVPVIAAGGIADARGVDAAMRLGAAGVQIGTAYLLCPEATTSPVYRAALRSPEAGHTALTNLISGRPARGIMNRLMRDLGPMSDLPPEFPLATPAVAPLRAAAEARGMGDFSPLWAGQNASGCREMPAAQLTSELAGGLR